MSQKKQPDFRTPEHMYWDDTILDSRKIWAECQRILHGSDSSDPKSKGELAFPSFPATSQEQEDWFDKLYNQSGGSGMYDPATRQLTLPGGQENPDLEYEGWSEGWKTLNTPKKCTCGTGNEWTAEFHAKYCDLYGGKNGADTK